MTPEASSLLQILHEKRRTSRPRYDQVIFEAQSESDHQIARELVSLGYLVHGSKTKYRTRG